MKLKQLQTIIDKYDEEYYTNGSSLLEDYKYDELKEELRALNPGDPRLSKVGTEIKNSILEKTAHKIPMGSLAKASTCQEFLDWVKNNIVKAGIDNPVFFANLKMDGGSLGLEYKDGKLVMAIGRGDGLIGENITQNAVNFKGVPTLVKYNNQPFTGFVRGEAVLLTEDWLKIDPNQESNPRNKATGLSRRKNGEESEYISFYAFRLFDEDGAPMGEDEIEMNSILTSMGFVTSPFLIDSAKEVYKWFLEVAKIRSTYPYWIDGVVVKLNDIQKQLSLGESSNRPKAQVALKFLAENGTGTVLNVVHQVGSSGAVCPVCQLSDVRIGGTTINNASLYNYDYIGEIGLCIGDTVEVCKAGDIIPRVVEVVEQGAARKFIDIPTQCPICSSSLSRKSNINGAESSAIYCVNNQCPALVKGKIDKYLTSLDILGIGENLIEALINDLGVKDPADLYLLRSKEAQMANLLLSGKTRLGESRAKKFLDALDKKRELSLSDFLGSLGIFGLGKRRVVLIQDALQNKLDNLEDWFTDTLVKFAENSTVPNTAARINKEIINNKEYINRFITNGVKIIKSEKKEVKDGAASFCITGSLSRPKKFYQDLIEKSGNIYLDSFSKDLTYLVAADKDDNSSKLQKARKVGVQVIDEEDLLELI